MRLPWHRHNEFTYGHYSPIFYRDEAFSNAHQAMTSARLLKLSMFYLMFLVAGAFVEPERTALCIWAKSFQSTYCCLIEAFDAQFKTRVVPFLSVMGSGAEAANIHTETAIYDSEITNEGDGV